MYSNENKLKRGKSDGLSTRLIAKENGRYITLVSSTDQARLLSSFSDAVNAVYMDKSDLLAT